LGLIYILYRLNYYLQKSKQYPPTVKALWLPFLGHIPGFGSDPVAFFRNQIKLLGPVFSLELFGRNCVFLSGVEAVDAFYRANEDVLSAKEAYGFTVPAFGPNVVYDVPHKKFQQQRKFAHSSLTVSQFKKFVPMMVEEVENYLNEKWVDQGTVDFYDEGSHIIMRTSTRCLQGEQIRELISNGSKYVEWMSDIDSSLSVLSFFFPKLPLPSFKKRDLARKKIGDTFQKVLQHRIDNDYQGDDFLELLRSKHYEDGSSVTHEEIAGLSVALMLAGYHTSNITSSWFGICLLSNPKVVEAVREEQQKVLGDSPLDLQKLKEMELLDNCMTEALRLRPPIILVWRVATSDFKWKDFIIPKGTYVCVSPAVQGRSDAFTNPDQYDPWRFSPERMEGKDTSGFFCVFYRSPLLLRREICLSSSENYLVLHSQKI